MRCARGAGIEQRLVLGRRGHSRRKRPSLLDGIRRRSLGARPRARRRNPGAGLAEGRRRHAHRRRGRGRSARCDGLAAERGRPRFGAPRGARARLVRAAPRGAPVRANRHADLVPAGRGFAARGRDRAPGSSPFLAVEKAARKLLGHKRVSSRIAVRPVSLRVHDQLVREGLHPVLARVCASRGIRGRRELEDALSGLLPPSELLGAERAALLLADAIAAGKRMLIVADYDCDGATACALGVRALTAFGASVGYLVPNRFEFGYGLTPEIVALAAQSKPDLLVTVDNGIASVEGVEAARALGIEVIVTDHHLPGAELPRAAAIVNPNQPGCAFPSKNLAGVGVMFYVMLELRAELRKRGAFSAKEEPNLGDVLDLLALGTVADVVPLDFNNRVLVAQGLKRIRAGRMQEGVRALFAVAGRDPARAAAERRRAPFRHEPRDRVSRHSGPRARPGHRAATRRAQPRAARDRGGHAAPGR